MLEVTQLNGFGAGSNYDSDSMEYFSAMPSPPDDFHAVAIDLCIRTLKSAGIWSKMDLFYFLALHDQGASLINAKSPGTGNLTAVNSPSFVKDRGWKGDGATSYLTSGITLVTGTTAYTQNSAHAGVWNLTAENGDSRDLGSGTTNPLFIDAKTASGNLAVRINDASALQVANTDPKGYYIANRSAATARQLYRNSFSVASDSQASASGTGWSTFDINRANTGIGARQHAIAHCGSSLSSADVSTLYGAVSTYLLTIGAWP